MNLFTEYSLVVDLLQGDDTHAEVKCNSLPCPPLECNDTIFLNDRDCCPSCRMENFANCKVYVGIHVEAC